MLCLTLFLAIVEIATADIKPICEYRNFKIECIVSYMLKSLDANEFKATILIAENKMDATLHINDTFTDITVKEAVKNNIPFILTDEISGVSITKGFDSRTIFYVSFFKNCEPLTNFVKALKKKIEYFIIIHEICESIVNDILNELQYFEVLFIVLNQDNGFTSWKIITEINENSCRSCGRTVKHRFKVCDDYVDNKVITQLSTRQARLDLKMCKLNVGMASLYPYSVIKNKELLKTFDPLRLEDMHGSDVEMIKILANYYNATLNLHYIQRSEENPYFDSEYLNFVVNGSLDACAGGLYKIYGDVVSYSGIYSSQRVIWVYTVERNTRSWQILIGKMHGLYIFLIFYILHTIIWSVICKFDGEAVSKKDTLLYSWGALLGASTLQDARTVKQKILNILYLILGMYLSTYISCQIYSYLTIEEPPPHYKTVDGLKTSNKTPYLVPLAKYFVDDKKYEAYANTSRDCIDFNDCEDKLLKYNASTILIDGYLPHLQARTAVDGEARVLKVATDILTIYHEMIIRKYSPLVKSYKKVTLRLFESGICQKLYLTAIDLTVVDKARLANRNILTNSYSCLVGCKITLLQLAGIFYIWLFGCVLSIVVFIVEIFYHREIKQ